MIVEPGFLDHYKTQALIHAAGETAPLMLIRLWEHCQCRKTHRFPNLTDVALASICRWSKAPAELKAILLECGFLRVENNVVIVHDWEKSNRHLIGAWVNGAKGGRPRKLQKPKTDRLTDRVTDPSIYLSDNKKCVDITSVLKEGVRGRFDEWMKFRRGMGKKPSNWDTLFSKQAHWLLQFNETDQNEILDQSMRNGWQGLFVPGKNGQKQQGKPERPSRQDEAERWYAKKYGQPN